VPSPTPSPPEEGDSVREIVVLLPEVPDSLNPFYARSWSARALADLFLPGLWHLDGSLIPHPELAREIPSRANGGISVDGRTFTVRLRPEATWSDGWPLTADDLLFTYEMAVSEANAVASRFPYSWIEGVTVVDAATAEVRFSQPFAPWPSMLFTAVLPRHVLEPVFEREGTLDRAVWNRLPTVGSGPFAFVSADQAGGMVFEANPRYWRGRPPVDRVRALVLTAPEDRVAAVTRDEGDFAPLLWPEEVGWVGAPPGVRLLAGASGFVETLRFNLDPRTGHPALQQEAVRRAIAEALDTELVCGLLAPGRAEPARSLWSGTLFEDPTLGLSISADSSALLDGAGWRDENGDGVRERDGVPLVLRYAALSGGVSRETVQAAVQEMLARVGIGVEPLAWTDGAGWDLAQWAEPPAGYPDPDDPRWLCVEARPGGTNLAGVCDEELDALLSAQSGTADLDARTSLFHQIEVLNRERAWWIPLCQLSDQWVASDRIQDAHPWRGQPFWDAWRW
jgi:peptide/nickel transport system substrate-binding protein